MKRIIIGIAILIGIGAGHLLTIGRFASAAPTAIYLRDIFPETTNTYNLGTSTRVWAEVNTQRLKITNLGSSGSPCLIISNASGTVATSTCGALTGSGTSTQVAFFGVNSSTLTSSPNFIYNATTGLLTVGSSSITNLTVTNVSSTRLDLITSVTSPLAIITNASATRLDVSGIGNNIAGIIWTNATGTSATLTNLFATNATATTNLALSYGTGSRCLRLDADKNIVAASGDCPSGDTQGTATESGWRGGATSTQLTTSTAGVMIGGNGAAKLFITSTAVGSTTLLAQGMAEQTADLFQLSSSSGQIYFNVSNLGLASSSELRTPSGTITSVFSANVSSTRLDVSGGSTFGGAVSFKNTVTIDPIRSFTFGTATGTTATSSFGIANASITIATIRDLFNAAGDRYVTSTSASTGGSTSTWCGDGSDGTLNITSGTTTINLANATVTVKQYSSFSITDTGILAFSNANASGSIFIAKVNGNATINSTGTSTINMRGLGGSGGSGGTSGGSGAANDGGGGGSMAGKGTASTAQANQGGTPGTNGNGFGWYNFWLSIGGEGGLATTTQSAAAGYATTTAFGAGISHFDNLKIFNRYIVPGSGGGGGAGNVNGDGGAGGAGGGAFLAHVCGIFDFPAGSIDVSGTDGVHPTNRCGGGGGGGGALIVKAYKVSSTAGTVAKGGGDGGDGSCGAADPDGATGFSAIISDVDTN